MRKLVFLILIIISFFSTTIVTAKTCDMDKVSISSIIVDDKTDIVEENNLALINGMSINLDISMSEVGDYIRYKFIVKNEGNEDFELDKNSFNISSDYIDYIIETEDNSNIIKANSFKTVYLVVKYINKIPEELFELGKFNDNKIITIQISNGYNNVLINPNTGVYQFIFIFAVLIITSAFLYQVLRKKKYTNLLVFIICLSILIPISVYSLCKYEIKIESNITIPEEKSNKATDIIKNLVSNADPTSTEVFIADEVSDSCDNALAFDGTNDNNLRYVGTNPCNYVSFNDELWRIIGVMNNVDDGTGKKETRIKIVRGEPLDNYSWNQYLGPNDWSKTPMMSQLNNNYFNEEINDTAKKMIGDTVWYLGGATNSSNTADAFYQLERSTSVWGTLAGQVCDDSSCPRSTEWTGKIAFMYPSDYGFSVSYRDCLNNTLNQYASYCKFMSWFKAGELFITPSNTYYNYIFSIENSGYGVGNIVYYYAYQSARISPSLFLKSDVKIVSGNGSQDKPFVLT